MTEEELNAPISDDDDDALAFDYVPGLEVNPDIEAISCNWEDCSRSFWVLEDMTQHLGDDHINSQNTKKPVCDWVDCVRKGKPQASRFALVAHLRSHTGEKPFTCPRPGTIRDFGTF